MSFCFPRLFSLPTLPYQRNLSLYNSCPWEDRAIRKLIADGKIAARLKGTEYRTTLASDQECPICFLYYTEVNVTKCCNANVCTECFLQVRPQKESQATCPFCNSSNFTVSVAQKPSDEEIKDREKNEQMVIEARIRAERGCGGAGSSNHDATTPVKKKSGASVAPDSSSLSCFGSELEKDERFQLLKKRTESFASNEGTRTPQKDAEIIQSIAMTPEERRRLEEEMKAQHNHPLSLRVEAEAHERRLQNEQAYYRSNSVGSNTLRAQRAADLFRSNSSNGAAATRRLRYRGARDWNQIVESFERGGNGDVNSLDDLVVLEAAILLSMEAEAEANRERDRGQFDAARHAGAGFPLVRSLFGGNDGDGGNGDRTAAADASSESAAERTLRRLNASRRRHLIERAAGSGSAARHRGLMAEAALDTASMMMRGISEEEQIAMAIAASLEEQQNTSNDAENAEEAEGGGSSSSSGDNSNDSGSISSNSRVDDATLPSNDTQSSVHAQSSLGSHQASEQGNGNEATTINELARVVTDSGAGVTSGDAGDNAQSTSDVPSTTTAPGDNPPLEEPSHAQLHIQWD
jgi:hypothetical protein